MATSKKRDFLGRPGVDPSDSRGARAAALAILARRDRTAEELHRKLLDKGYERPVVDLLIERLQQEKLLDDRRYVENYVGFHADRGQGPMRVRRDLSKLGLPATLVQEALDAYPNWLVQLKKAQQKKFGSGPPTDYADRQRQSRFLGYRGFTGSQIRLALGADIDLDNDLMQTADDL